MARIVMSSRCRMVQDKYGIKFISGKWFAPKNDKLVEIRQIDKFLLLNGITTDVNDSQKWRDTYVAMYGESGLWPEMPIIEEAKRTMDQKHDMCYPLNEKQLIIINYLLRHDEEICFILTGVGGSGKSTFGNIICKIFDDDTAALNLSDLSNEFMLATAADKRLIYSTEINSDKLNNGKLKQLFSNEIITYNPKGRTPFQARCQSALFFNCNVCPKLDLWDSGLLRRILYYSMNKKIENPDTTLNKKEWTHEDVVNIVRHALSVDMTNWQKKFEVETRYHLLKDNTVFMFYEKKDYEAYVSACYSSGMRSFSEPHWNDIRSLIDKWGGKEYVVSSYQSGSL